MAPVESAPHPHATVPDPLANAKFSLNSLGVAGFFGADVAVNGMATVIFFAGRRLGGLYNSPGSLEIARRYGQLADSRVYRGLFPGDTTDPAQLFGLDGKDGPRFLGLHSGSLIEKTSHLGYLIMRMAKRETCPKNTEKGQRSTTPGTVTIVDLRHLSEDKPKSHTHPTTHTHLKHYGPLALFPVGASIGGCVGSALVADWWSFGCILLGMVANGCACFVLGSGKLTFRHPNSAKTAPRGDGILWSGNDIVVIRGSERAVNTVTRGRFFLQYDEDAQDPQDPQDSQNPQDTQDTQDTHDTQDTQDRHDASSANRPALPNGENANGTAAYGDSGAPRFGNGERNVKRDGDYDAPKGGKPNSVWIGIASLLLILQFLVQLFLIPQATLFGQLMFVCTLAASGAYNAYLSSINREDIQTEILCNILELNHNREARVKKFEFTTWTSTATFACLALQRDYNTRFPDSSKVLHALIPNDTEVWNGWKIAMGMKVWSKKSWDNPEEETPEERRSGHDQATKAEQTQPTKEEAEMLKVLNEDAELAHRRYLRAFPPSP